VSTPIRNILSDTSALRSKVANSLGALRGADKKLIHENVRTQFADSLEIDDNLRQGNDRENRWDYILGHGPSTLVIGLEPHTATTSEVSSVVAKRKAALVQLRPHLKGGASVAEWFWVSSGRVDFVPHEKQVNRLAQSGITFVGSMLLGKHLPPARSKGSAKKP
jgi:hypothetical protein